MVLIVINRYYLCTHKYLKKKSLSEVKLKINMYSYIVNDIVEFFEIS